MTKFARTKSVIKGCLMIVLSNLCCWTLAQEANLILHNGNIVTLNEQQPRAQALAISGNKIVYLGDNPGTQQWQSPSTKIIDLNGKTVIPGFIESHAHFYGLGQSKQNLDLSTAKNYAELINKVEQAAKQSAPGDWIIGRGWHQSKWTPQPSPNIKGFQTHQALSAVTPNNPVYLVHASGHAAFANANAMSLAGIDADSSFTEGGEIIKDQNGHPTGVFTENAESLIASHIGKPSSTQRQQAYQLATEEALRYGITSFHDAGSSRIDIKNFRRMGDEGQLRIRLYTMIDGHDTELLNEWLDNKPLINQYDSFLTIRAIKLRADGALGSRGAWLLDDYSDRPDHRGSATMSMPELEAISKHALDNGFQLAVHAIGDRANKEVLDRFQQAFRSAKIDGKRLRFRIEHAQHLSLSDIPRFAQLGVIASMQSIHMSSDRPWAIERLGKQRIDEGAYVWQKLIENGTVIVNGTDAPVEPINPFANFYAAVTRKTLTGTPDGGYEASQKMTREQALRSYTIDAAFAAFEENIKGTIEVGKLADLAVLSQDIMTIPEAELLNTQVLTTIVNGKIVYQQADKF